MFPAPLQTFLPIAACFTLVAGVNVPQLLYQYNTPTWVENFAVRKDGQILPARATSAVLTQLDLHLGTVSTIANKSSVGSAIMGITEIVPDLFAMSTMYCDLSKLSCTPGTGITWSVDLRHTADVSQAQVTKLVEGPRKESLLNGMAALNPRTVLMVDQALGAIWAVDMLHGGAKLAIQIKAMEDPKSSGNGVNGIRVRNGTLYFNNPSLNTFCSVPIDMESGIKTGDVRVISSNLAGLDDFEIDEERGFAYITRGPQNALVKLRLATGHHHVFAKDLPGPTSTRWADGGQDGCALYVSTVGALPSVAQR